MVEADFSAAEAAEAMRAPNCSNADSSWSFRGVGGGRSWDCSSTTCEGSDASNEALMVVWE